jgi:hypothetical protein
MAGLPRFSGVWQGHLTPPNCCSWEGASHCCKEYRGNTGGMRISGCFSRWSTRNASWESVTPSFKIKTKRSSYVYIGSGCHTYDQNVSTENKCHYYRNSITRILSLQKRLLSTLLSSSSEMIQPHRQLTGGNVTTRVSRLMVATQEVWETI